MSNAPTPIEQREPSFATLFARQSARELATVETAIKTVVAARAAATTEAEKFTAWFRGEAHGNSVRAAERRAERLSYDAIQAVSAAARVDERIAAQWGYDALADDVLEALRTVQSDLAAKTARLRALAEEMGR